MTFILDPTLDADTHPVTDLALSTVRLMNDRQYPWLILVPMREGKRDLVDLDDADRQSLSGEVDRAQRVLKRLFDPHKLNVAALGNQVAQLHVHVIARHPDDAAWPAPVWGRRPTVAYEADEAGRLIERLRAAFA